MVYKSCRQQWMEQSNLQYNLQSPVVDSCLLIMPLSHRPHTVREGIRRQIDLPLVPEDHPQKVVRISTKSTKASVGILWLGWMRCTRIHKENRILFVCRRVGIYIPCPLPTYVHSFIIDTLICSTLMIKRGPNPSCVFSM